MDSQISSGYRYVEIRIGGHIEIVNSKKIECLR